MLLVKFDTFNCVQRNAIVGGRVFSKEVINDGGRKSGKIENESL